MCSPPGCDKHQADKEAIRDVFSQYGAARQAKNGVHAASLVTANTLEYFRNLVKVGLDGKKADIAKLCAADRSEIVMMRNRATRSQLKNLDGKGYIVFAYTQGWYENDGIDALELGKITVSDSCDRASAQVTFQGEMVGYFVVFVKEGEAWKLDETSIFPLFSNSWAVAAAEAGITEDQVILQEEEQRTGKPVSPTVWDPMR